MRYAGALGAAAAITLGLFLVLQYLVARGPVLIAVDENFGTLDFILLKRDEDAAHRTRVLPDKPPPPEHPPRPPQATIARTQPPAVPQLQAPTPDLETAGLASSPWLGSVDQFAADDDVIPLVRVAPQYPRHAARKGIEGWVKVEFTILEDGSVSDVSVVDAEPKRIFDREAIRAVMRWKFKPKVVDGKPVKRRANQVIGFKLQ